MKNSEYWAKRFEMLEDKQIKNAEKYLEELETEYKKAYLKLEEKISKWYARLAVNNQIGLSEAKQLLKDNELEEFKWTVEEYIKKGKESELNEAWIKQLENASARVHINKLQAIQVQIQAEIEQLYQKQQKDITNLQEEIFANTYYQSAHEIQTGLNVAWQVPALPKSLIEKIISKPWTNDNLTFSDRIWNNKNELISTLHTELTQAIIKGQDLKSVTETIAKRFKVDKNKAGRLVMTESAFFSSTGQKQCFNNLDVERYEIVATLDSHTSHICQELDGKIFEMKDFAAGITAPPFHCYCRSTTAPYFEDNYTERIARNEDGKTYYVPGDMKYKEWKIKYSDMTDIERGAIAEYSSSKAYVLNEKLRNHEKLDNTEKELIKNIDRGLDKLPNYTEVTYRQIGFDFQGEEEYNNFINRHKNNKYINYDQYISTSKSYNDYEIEDNLKIEMIIEGKTGKDIRGLTGIKEENEVLFKKDIWFEIIKCIDNKIWLKEV